MTQVGMLLPQMLLDFIPTTISYAHALALGTSSNGTKMTSLVDTVNRGVVADAVRVPFEKCEAS